MEIARRTNKSAEIRLYQAVLPARISARSPVPNCLGSYLFLWGSKQEETHTWFSFFDDEGRESPLVGLMQELWTGRQPANQAPVVRQLLTDGQCR